MSCTCPVSGRRWTEAGDCTGCGGLPSETQIQDEIRLALGSVHGLVLYRNNVGLNTHWPDGRKRDVPIKYGVGNPGGADLIGSFHGRAIAIETKTRRGVQSKDQKQFQACWERNGGIYLMPRSVAHAVNLVEALRLGFMADGTN